MSVILKRYKGESTTFGFVLPDDYNLTNMEDVKVYIGANVYPHTMDNVRTVKAKLTSEDTQLLTGRNSVIFHIDDAVFGIRKILVGEFQVDTSCDTFRDDSVNTGYDVLVMLKVEIDTIAVDAVLYDVAKGDKGDKGDNAFTVWQLQAGNEGKTEQDYFDFLQEPANEAIQQVLETEGEIIAAEGLRVTAEQGRFNAEVLRYDAEVLRIAQYGLSQQATEDANDAADLANEKAGIANQAAIDANNAIDNIASTLALKEDKSNKKSIINPTSTDEYPNSKGVADYVAPISLKVVEVEKDLNEQKAAIAEININQEVKQSVVGWDSIALPKNAADGHATVNLKGRTATNLIVNGDFKDGYSGWAVTSASEIIDYRSVYTAEASGSGIRQYFTKSGKFYLRLYIEPRNNFKAAFFDGVGFADQTVYPNNADGYYSFVWERDNINRIELSKSTAGVGTAISKITFISLTETFGAGNEPTKDACDKMFATYFEGTKSVDTPIRIKSVSQDGLKVSNLYIDNSVKLRSLPSGIRDEIRINSSGQYELVKRISDVGVELSPSIITPLSTSGSLISRPSGTVTIENAATVAGLYGAKMDVSKPTLLIKTIDKLSKIDFTTGVETNLDVNTAVVAGDKLSFTHPDLVSGDIVFFSYFYVVEDLAAETSVSYYDSRYVIKDKVTPDKYYKWVIEVSSGVASLKLTEV